MGTPGTGGLTLLVFFGDAGVVGRAAMSNYLILSGDKALVL